MSEEGCFTIEDIRKLAERVKQDDEIFSRKRDDIRYYLNSAGIKATEQEIEAIRLSGHPEALISALVQRNAAIEMDLMIKRVVLAQRKPFKFRRKIRR